MISGTASVSLSARIADSAKIWDLAQVRDGAYIGEGCVIGRGAYIGPGVVLGPNCKVQNYAQLHHPASLGEGVFVGPGAIFTNDKLPRAIKASGRPKSADDWNASGVIVGRGASIGAGSVCVAPTVIGEWAMIGAGAIVTRNVIAHSLVMGCPAKHVGWVCTCGVRLSSESTQSEGSAMTCDLCSDD